MLRAARLLRLMHLHPESTPNPLCKAFEIPSDTFDNFVPVGQSCEVAHRGLSWIHPLSSGLFEQYPQEVMSMFISPRKAAITVYANVDWNAIEWSISSYIGHYLTFNNICVAPHPQYTLLEDDLTIKDEDSEVVQCIKELLREQVRPMIQRDGGDVKFLGFQPDTGVVSLAMLGACRTCPSSENTLKEGIERVMRHFLPEVKEVREDKKSAFYEDFGLLFNSEKDLYREAARLDRQRQREMRQRLTPSIMSFEALNEPDGD
eukprot:gene4946-3547_t